MTDWQEALERFYGKRLKFVVAAIVLLLASPAQADRASDLAAATHATWPKYVSLNYAREVAAAAIAAETELLPAELLLGIASVESNFNPKVSNGVRFCGLTQANAGTKARCVQLRDPTAAFAQTVKQISRRLLANGGDVARALSGYGCGGPDTRTRPCSHKRDGWYHERVFARQRLIELKLTQVTTPSS